MCFHPTTRSLGLLYEFQLAFSVLVFAKTAVDDDGEDIEYPYTITSIEQEPNAQNGVGFIGFGWGRNICKYVQDAEVLRGQALIR